MLRRNLETQYLEVEHCCDSGSGFEILIIDGGWKNVQVVDEKALIAFETLLAEIWTLTDTLVRAQKKVKTMGRKAAPASETTCIVTDSMSVEI